MERPLPDQRPAVSQTFTYDAMDNHTKFVDGTRTTSYLSNAVNQYTSVSAPTPPAGQWQHDERGNLISDGTRRFTWDLQNNLSSAQTHQGTTRYAYDSGSRRVI